MVPIESFQYGPERPHEPVNGMHGEQQPPLGLQQSVNFGQKLNTVFDMVQGVGGQDNIEPVCRQGNILPLGLEPDGMIRNQLR